MENIKKFSINEHQMTQLRQVLMEALNNTQFKYSEWNLKGDKTMTGIYARELQRIMECNQMLMGLEQIIEPEDAKPEPTPDPF